MKRTIDKVLKALKTAKTAKNQLGIVLVLPSLFDLSDVTNSPYYLDRHDISTSMSVFCSDGYTKRSYEEEVTMLFLGQGYKEVKEVVQKLRIVL